MTLSEKAHVLYQSIPSGGLFAEKSWRMAPEPFFLAEDLYKQIIELGPRLHAFYKACNLLYRQSVEGKQAAWIHRYLDTGKPPFLVETSRHRRFKNDIPFVIRPDLLLTDDGLAITELDSVPGGIGLTAWLQHTHGRIAESQWDLNANGILDGFIAALRLQTRNLISTAENGHPPLQNAVIVLSEEAGDYRPEMEWLAALNLESQMTSLKLSCCSPQELEYQPGGVFFQGKHVDIIYRFFELFDLPNIANVEKMITAAKDGLVQVTPPFKPQLEEKLCFALFCFPQLADFWRCELGDRYVRDLKKMIPFTWLLDPSPLPPHAVIPHLDIQDWRQLAQFSQKQRNLILKISGFSERAWGSRGVFLGSDMPSEEWKEEVLCALNDFERHPHILQRFAKTRLVEHTWYDFEKETMTSMKGRLRLCPYYFIQNEKAILHGILATLCPPDKKLIHGMQDAIITLAIKKEET